MTEKGSQCIFRLKMKKTLTLIKYDMYLNFFLAILLSMYPSRVQFLLLEESVFPELMYVVFGLGFLVFALWQNKVFIKDMRMLRKDLIIAAWMAWIPVILLTIALVDLNLPIRNIGLGLLWIGNIYMLWLGFHYVSIAYKTKNKRGEN